MFDLQTCARPNVLSLEPYRCARDDFEDDGINILLDANENSFGSPLAHLKSSSSPINFASLNRYPDPHHTKVKQLLCQLRNSSPNSTSTCLTPNHLFVGLGSDEAIDNLIRCFCVPGRDAILICPPTYGVYSVFARANDVHVESVPLNPNDHFNLDLPAILAKLSQSPTIKLLFICSPGNPTGKLIDHSAILSILEQSSWNGVVVVDEAYIDFSPPAASILPLIHQFPNLVVLQTLSKAFGLAGLRVGSAFCPPPVARLMNNLKAAYNLPSPTINLACFALSRENLQMVFQTRDDIITERSSLAQKVLDIPGVGRLRSALDANFILVEILDSPSSSNARPSNKIAHQVYHRLATKYNVIVRFRGNELNCQGCIRITVGTEKQNQRLIDALTQCLRDVYT